MYVNICYGGVCVCL